MGEPSEPENGEATAMPGVFEIKARPYQREMMEESLKRNIIVAVGHNCTFFVISRADCLDFI